MTSAYDESYDEAEYPAPPSDLATLHVIENFAPTPAGRPSATLAPADDELDDSRSPQPETEAGDEPRPKRTGGGRGPVRRRLGGLDGLRAIAVMAVVVFHLDFSLLPGGFLGVDVFFVISGFLITNLIANEILTDGRLRLGRFYLRRARRLLPTVFVLLAAVTLAANTFWRDQIPTLRGGVVSSLGYFTNWWLIADHQSYFVASGRPTMLQHLWSLAIEEQFYLVWTAAVVLLAGGVFAARRAVEPARRLRVVIWLAAALALGATLLMAVFAESEDLPYGGSTSRVYFGSDTHSMGLFVGSAFGAYVALRHHRRTVVPSRRLLSAWRRLSIGVTDLIGLAALVATAYQFVHIDEYTPRLYRGGFLAFDAAVMVTVLCATRPGSLFGRVLDVRPVQWLGQRSYSIYIWHWPVCVVTRPGIDVEGSALWVNTARLVLILGLSTLSYRYIEVQLRSGSLRLGALRLGALRDRRERVPAHHRPAWVFASVSATAVATLALVLNPAVSAPLGVRPPHLNPSPVVAQSSSTPSTSHSASHGAANSTGPSTSHASGSTHHQVPPAGTGHTSAPSTPPPLSISAYGDSVLLGAKTTLRDDLGNPARLDLDAVEGRQASDVLDDVLADARNHRLRPCVLIHVGDNGVISPDQLRQTLQALSDRKRVVLMTLRVPRDWQDVNNNTIRSVARSFPNVRVENWASESDGRVDWLYSDGIHLRADGAVAYAQIVINAFRAK